MPLLKESEVDRKCYKVTVLSQRTFAHSFYKTWHDLTRSQALEIANLWRNNVLTLKVLITANYVVDGRMQHFEEEFELATDPKLVADCLANVSLDQRGWTRLPESKTKDYALARFDKKRAVKLVTTWQNYDPWLTWNDYFGMLRGAFPLADKQQILNFIAKEVGFIEGSKSIEWARDYLAGTNARVANEASPKS